MSVILVVERDTSRSERISDALRSDGLTVTTVAGHAEALSSAEERAPGLLLASSALPEASALLADFSHSRGGPGAVVLAPAAEGASAADYQADELLAEPYSDDQLREIVQRCLATAPDSRPEAARRSDKTERLTSADIFGDVLAEVEAEARSTKPAPGARKPPKPTGDLERRLEETLSGVIPVAGRAKRPNRARTPEQRHEARKRRPALPPETEIDRLLDQTLSSLDIPTRPRKPKTPTAPPATTAPRETSAPPIDAEPAPPEPNTRDGRFPDTQRLTKPSPEPQAPGIEIEPEDAVATSPPGRSPVEEARAEETPAEETPAEEARTQRRAGDTPPQRRAGDTLPQRRAGDTPPQRRADDPSSASKLSAQAPASAPAGPTTDQFRTRLLPTVKLAAEASSGETFGDYTLLDRIAIGGMAEVWRARRRGVEGFQKTVAIKKILSHLTGSKDFVTMFIDEAKLAAQLSHNNIIQIYDLGKVGDDFFIAMEHVDGKDLRSVLTAAQESSRPIPPSLGLLIVSAVASALHYAHRKRDFDNRALGLVHRDVSPQNVMVSYEGAIKLCDFGIVKAVAKASTTQLGALKGKLQYMSPEQAWGKSVDARSDIFSLGSVMFEVLTGTQLFSGDSEISVLDAVRECRIRSPREIVPEIPEEVDRIVSKALAKSPEERFQTAGDLEQEITAVLDNLRPTPSQKDLASYLHSLFEPPKSGAVALTPQDAEQPVAEPETEMPGAEMPGAEMPGAEKPEAEKPGAAAGGPATGSGRWKLIAAAVLFAILIGIGFLALPSLLKREASTPPAAAPAPRVAPPEAPAPDRTPAEAAAAGTGDNPTGDNATGETAGDAEGTPTADTEDTAGELAAATSDDATQDGPTETGSPVAAGEIDIEQMVKDQLTERAELLTRDLEAKKRRLEEELARTKAESRPSSEDGKEGDDNDGKNGDGES